MIIEETKSNHTYCHKKLNTDFGDRACDGHMCAAWRWLDIKNPNWFASPVGTPDYMHPFDKPQLTVKSTTHGYCGLAGKP